MNLRIRINNVEMVRKIIGSGMNGSITTNGTLLDQEHIRELVELGWDLLVFSIDGGDPETNDRLRGMAGAFKKAAGAQPF